MERLEKKPFGGLSTTSRKKLIKNGGKYLSERNIILMHVHYNYMCIEENKRISDLITSFYY